METLCKEWKELEELTTYAIIKQLKSQKEKYLDIEIYVGAKSKVPVRLIANLLTEEQTKKRIKKKKENRPKLGKDVLEGACLNLFVTNMNQTLNPADEIFKLYTQRWQIELIFKTWKSIIGVNSLHSMNSTRLTCILLIKLLWVLLNWSMANKIKNQGREILLKRV